MANLKSFEQFVAEQDRAEEIEKDIVDQGSPEEHDAEEADAVQSQGQETNEATDVTGIQADALKDDSKDVTPPVVDADGKKYAKAEDRAEDDSSELNADLAKTAKGEVIAKVVVESKESQEAEAILDDLLGERDMDELHGMSMEDATDTVSSYGHKGSKLKKIAQELYSLCNESNVNENTMADALNQIHLVLSSAPAIETQVAIGKALMALAISGAVSPVVLKAIELFKKESPKAAAKIEANESTSVVEEKALPLDKLTKMIGDKPSCYDLADFVYTNYDKVTGLRKSMRNDEMEFPLEIYDLVDHYGFDYDDFTDKYGMAAESLKVNESLDRASIKRMEGVVSQANLKKMLDGISGVIADLTDDGFEYEEAVDYVAFKIDDKLAGKF
jgi:hypothetical protein